MRRYFVLFSGKNSKVSPSSEVVEYGTGKTMIQGLRSAWARLLKSERPGIVKATVSELTSDRAEATRFALRGGNWVRVGKVEPNKPVKQEEEVGKIS